MYIETAVYPTMPKAIGDLSPDNCPRKERFQDVLQNVMSNGRSSRPPKVRLKGILVPCEVNANGMFYRYKLATDSMEYLLRIADSLDRIARAAAWEEVTVTGRLESEHKVLDVERITLGPPAEAASVPPIQREPSLDFDSYCRMIARLGKLEPAPDGSVT